MSENLFRTPVDRLRSAAFRTPEFDAELLRVKTGATVAAVSVATPDAADKSAHHGPVPPFRTGAWVRNDQANARGRVKECERHNNVVGAWVVTVEIPSEQPGGLPMLAEWFSDRCRIEPPSLIPSNPNEKVVRVAQGLIAQAETRRFLVNGFEIVRGKPFGWIIAGHEEFGVFADPLEAALRIG